MRDGGIGTRVRFSSFKNQLPAKARLFRPTHMRPRLDYSAEVESWLLRLSPRLILLSSGRVDVPEWLVETDFL